MEKVLVVAFDGMDKELIESYGLENVSQKEFGSIENSAGIKERMTSELFASFITGTTHENHGVEGLSTSLDWRDRFVEYIFPRWTIENIPGMFRLKTLVRGDSQKERTYTKSDLNEQTLFEKIELSLPLYVPSYNPDPIWHTGFPHKITPNFSEESWVDITRWHTEARLNFGIGNQPAFFDVSKGFWEFIMLHLHDPDSFQDTGLGNLEEEYDRLDRITEEILTEYEGWTIIFMSDHGRPDGRQHNENAFYSCNKELFGDETPHITDFHDTILELTGNEDKIDFR